MRILATRPRRLAVSGGVLVVQVALALLNLAVGNPRIAAFCAFVAGWVAMPIYLDLLHWRDERRAA